MKILHTAETAKAAKVVNVAKRDGLYVSRPLLPDNAQKWYDWAVKYGVPEPLKPEEMHVTIVYSTVDVKLPMSELPITITTGGDYGESGVFCMMGPDEDAFAYCFRSYELYWRNEAFICAGATTSWPTYRPHLTLSTSAKGFEISDAALADVPRYIILGPEVNAAVGKPDPTDDSAQDGDGDDDDDIILIVVLEATAEKAKAMLEADAEKNRLSPMDAYALADVAKGAVTRGVAKRLASIDTMPAEIKALADAEKAGPRITTTVRKRVEADMVVEVRSLPEDVLKKLKTRDVAKTNDEEQIVMGIASVSTVNGELVKDLHGDFVTTRALQEFNRSLISGTRAGKFDHEGDAVTEIVAGLVLSEEWQKSLDIDLGFEPYLVEIHVPDETDWAEVKKGDWMLSVAGRMWFYEDQANAQV